MDSDVLSQHRRSTQRLSLPDVGGMTSLMKSEAKRDMREIEKEAANGSAGGATKREATLRVKTDVPTIAPFLTLASKRRRWRKWEREPQTMARELSTRRVANAQTRADLGAADEGAALARVRFAAVRSHFIARLSMLRRQRNSVDEVVEALQGDIGDVGTALGSLVDLGAEERRLREARGADRAAPPDDESDDEDGSAPKQRRLQFFVDGSDAEIAALGDRGLAERWERLGDIARQGAACPATLEALLRIDVGDDADEVGDGGAPRSLLTVRDDGLFGDASAAAAALALPGDQLLRCYVTPRAAAWSQAELLAGVATSKGINPGAWPYPVALALLQPAAGLAARAVAEEAAVADLRKLVADKEAEVRAAADDLALALAGATADRRAATVAAAQCAAARAETDRLRKEAQALVLALPGRKGRAAPTAAARRGQAAPEAVPEAAAAAAPVIDAAAAPAAPAAAAPEAPKAKAAPKPKGAAGRRSPVRTAAPAAAKPAAPAKGPKAAAARKAANSPPRAPVADDDAAGDGAASPRDRRPRAASKSRAAGSAAGAASEEQPPAPAAPASRKRPAPEPTGSRPTTRGLRKDS
ncbi:hypothetical protein M885DRAFT_516417 [Pelagophyceae sp. CCMP2097]|nr:hypothetical protein M885DRAFT_516417 [Pelagophyceae sp. CCMP2097]